MHVINKTMLVLSFGLLVACSSNASLTSEETTVSVKPETADTNPTIAKSDVNPKNQVICKARAITGSRFKQKTCMTAKEWKTMSQESKKIVDKATRNKVRYTN